MDRWQKYDKTERAKGLVRKTREEIGKGNQMTALRFQTCSPHNYGRQYNDAVSRPVVGLTSESWSEQFTSYATFIIPRVSAEGLYTCHILLLYLMCVQLVNTSLRTQRLSYHVFQLKGNIYATFHYCTQFVFS